MYVSAPASAGRLARGIRGYVVRRSAMCGIDPGLRYGDHALAACQSRGYESARRGLSASTCFNAPDFAGGRRMHRAAPMLRCHLRSPIDIRSLHCLAPLCASIVAAPRRLRQRKSFTREERLCFFLQPAFRRNRENEWLRPLRAPAQAGAAGLRTSASMLYPDRKPYGGE